MKTISCLFLLALLLVSTRTQSIPSFMQPSMVPSPSLGSEDSASINQKPVVMTNSPFGTSSSLSIQPIIHHPWTLALPPIWLQLRFVGQFQHRPHHQFQHPQFARWYVQLLASPEQLRKRSILLVGPWVAGSWWWAQQSRILLRHCPSSYAAWKV